MRTANPALSDKVFQSVHATSTNDVMTLDGTVNKTAISILITMVAAYVSWTNPAFAGLTFLFFILAFIVAIAVSFKKNWAPVLTPVYAACSS